MQFSSLFVAAVALVLPAAVSAGYCQGTTCIDSIKNFECPKQCPKDGTCALNVACF
ncbi:uncharacterized protein BDZ83DRAFT_752653 [Colletotrichum acutatum]|uniref:Uncharacterized protein n=1 Tax=Glomerella acutata TaxID=27357 RepID=A0AAD8XFJ6_GLOAC|nr:uncharacterized protein BDZ83DRAFT_752653 [Colletotrichum acutatum]KAK1724411.1 hypothetical protein BDZ83DRAFT_752653 [Colletotrichum acutatum]